MEVSDKRHAQAAMASGEGSLGSHWMGGWISLESGMDVVAKWKISVPTGI
jgi:hypothetical protein